MRHVTNAGRIGIVFVLSALLAACGGGGHSAAVPAPQTSAASKSGLQRVVVTINIPGKAPAGKRRTTYVGAGTKSAVFVVTPVGASPSPSVTTNCTTVCQAVLGIPAGNTSFSVSLFDDINGGGSLLSKGTLTQMITIGTDNAVNITFNGVPVTAIVDNPNPAFASGTPGTGTLTVDALDADGNIIVTPGTFDPAITLSSAQSYITLSPATVTVPSSPVTATYDGTPVGSTTNVGISAAIGTNAPLHINDVVVQVASGPTLMLDQTDITVTSSGGTGTVTVSESGFSGTFTADDTFCSGPLNATVSPSSASGPSATFTITGNQPTIPGLGCSITFGDGTQTITLAVSVN